jgi:hypothetical protein
MLAHGTTGWQRGMSGHGVLPASYCSLLVPHVAGTNRCQGITMRGQQKRESIGTREDLDSLPVALLLLSSVLMQGEKWERAGLRSWRWSGPPLARYGGRLAWRMTKRLWGFCLLSCPGHTCLELCAWSASQANAYLEACARLHPTVAGHRCIFVCRNEGRVGDGRCTLQLLAVTTHHAEYHVTV